MQPEYKSRAIKGSACVVKLLPFAPAKSTNEGILITDVVRPESKDPIKTLNSVLVKICTDAFKEKAHVYAYADIISSCFTGEDAEKGEKVLKKLGFVEYVNAYGVKTPFKLIVRKPVYTVPNE